MEHHENAQPLALRSVNRAPCLPDRLAEADHARVTQVRRTASGAAAVGIQLRVYFACGNMAALNEDFS